MRVGVLMQHLLTGTLLVTSVLGGLNSEGDSEQPFNRTRPCQPQSLPIETFSISATTDGNSIPMCRRVNVSSTFIRTGVK